MVGLPKERGLPVQTVRPDVVSCRDHCFGRNSEVHTGNPLYFLLIVQATQRGPRLRGPFATVDDEFEPCVGPRL